MNPVLRHGLLMGVLAVAVLASALAVVRAKHENRKLFAELQVLAAQRDQLEVDWSRLQIEQSVWSSHARVEQLGREQMHMRSPGPDEIRSLP